MASEYLSDREQEEALRNWWRENWRWVASGIAVGFVVLAGWNYWKAGVNLRAEGGAQAYRELGLALANNDKDKVDASIRTLDTDFKRTPYADQAHLLMAQAHVNAGRYEMAVTDLQVVVDKSNDPALAAIAKIRLARVHIQLGHYDEALALLDVDKAGVFAPQVQEIRGDALLAKGDRAGARAAYQASILAAQAGNVHLAPNANDYLHLKLQELAAETPESAAPAVSIPAADGTPVTNKK
jgi:predicted negative regulator of RcsB-dependent stress response